MTNYYMPKEMLVQSVSDQLSHLEPGYALTMIIRRDMSGAYSASIATGELSEDIVKKMVHLS